jgi:hypothetical protein
VHIFGFLSVLRLARTLALELIDAKDTHYCDSAFTGELAVDYGNDSDQEALSASR